MYTAPLVDIYAELEREIFEKMAELLKTDPNMTKEYALEWQIEKMRQIGILNIETINELADVVGVARNELASTFNAIAGDTIYTVDQQVKRLGKEVLENPPTEMDSLLQTILDYVFDDLDNLVNARLPGRNGVAAQVYTDIVSQATTSAMVGNKTINQAVTESIIKAREKGLPTGFVDKGGRVWNVQNYTDLLIRTAANQTYNNLSTERMKDYDIDLVRVDYYAGARPTCAQIQGKVCSMSNPSSDPKYPSIYEFGYGTPSGIRGIHCRHRLYPFVDGVSTNNENPPDVTEANKVYKEMQKQRSLERNVRKAKADLRIAEITGDEHEIARTKSLVRSRQMLVRQWTEKTGLPRRYDKERVI